MAESPRVSVVMPTRDRAALLRRAVDAVLRQTVRELELIVVDDASRDATADVLRDLERADPRVRVVRNRTARGAAAARNRGAELARAPCLAFMDDDVQWRPHTLERQLAALEGQRPRVGAVYCPIVRVEPDGRRRTIGGPEAAGEGGRACLFRRNFVDTSAVLLRRDLFRAVGGFDERLPRLQDWDLWLRLTRESAFAFVDEPLVTYHVTAGSISSRDAALAQACDRLWSKYAREDGMTPARRADLAAALAHALMMTGQSTRARAFFRRAAEHGRPGLRVRLLGAAAALGAEPYRRLIRWRERRAGAFVERLVSLFWRLP